VTQPQVPPRHASDSAHAGASSQQGSLAPPQPSPLSPTLSLLPLSSVVALALGDVVGVLDCVLSNVLESLTLTLVELVLPSPTHSPASADGACSS
jgi:hypothetical protein